MTRTVGTFRTVRTEGGLLPSDLLGRVADGRNGLPGLSPEGYHLAPGEKLNEAISRSWNRMLGVWATFTDTLGRLPDDERTATTITRQRWSLVLFQELGFGQLQTMRAVEIDGKSYPASHGWGPVPIHLLGVRVNLNHRTPGVIGASQMSPHAMVQELLNRSDDHLWGIISNGLCLRLLRDNAALTRQAYVEFDLEAMFEGQEYADFALLWLVCHQSRFEGDIPEKCLLEQWMADAADKGTRALDQLRGGVTTALEEMGRGFLAHSANAVLRKSLQSGHLDKQDYYRQLLRVVYRLLFLLVTEARDVLLDPESDPTAQQRYREFYSLSRVHRLAHARRGGAHEDLWRQVRVAFDGLGRSEGLPDLGLPALGSFLWSDRATPDLDGAELANRDLMAALRALSSVRDGSVTRAVDFRNLASEELGSIYESLLELHPELSIETRSFALTTAAGNERKTTGSYYTPTPLINELLDSALDPVLDEAARSHDPESAILDLAVLDPACGSGHFLIAAAHRIAARLATVRSGEDEPSPRDLQHALRDVVARCVHGIDVNEMAVELCKVSLWLEAVEPGRPLAFLDHRIVCGNSLLGTTPRLLADGIPDDAFKPLTGDDKTVVSELRRANKQERRGQETLPYDSTNPAIEAVAGAYAEIDAVADDSMSGVQAKESRWHDLLASREYDQARFVADAWCAAFVAPKRKGGPVITTGFIRHAEENPLTDLDSQVVAAVRRLQHEYRFLHMHLAFPDVFRVPAPGETPDNEHTGWSGGFDVVLGNPPWEHVELKEKEFFATRAPLIAEAQTGAARKKLIAELKDDNPLLYSAYTAALRRADGERRMLASSGRFPLCGRGRVNTYAVFAEAMRDGLAPSGHVGVIVPLGIATDDTTKRFFGDLVESASLLSLFGFENEEFLFPGVHHSTKFCLLTATDRAFKSGSVDMCFFARQVPAIEEPSRRFTLTPEDFKLINPNTGTCPIFRTTRDAEIAKAVYRRVPVLVEEPSRRNPWSITFRQGLFNMATDSGLFHKREEMEDDGWKLAGNVLKKDGEQYLPLYEAKMLHHFDHRYGTYEGQTQAQANQGTRPRLPVERQTNPTSLVQPRYWIADSEVASAANESDRWWVAFRDIARNTDQRTAITSVIPPVAVGHTAPIVRSRSRRPHLLAAGMTCFVFDYLCRQILAGTHLTFTVFRQLPVPPPEWFEEAAAWDRERTLAEWIKPRVLELTYTAWDLEGFGRDLGWDGPPFRWDDERRSLLRAELGRLLLPRLRHRAGRRGLHHGHVPHRAP